MRKIKEKRMQSYVLRARKMVQEGKNKEGAEMLSEQRILASGLLKVARE